MFLCSGNVAPVLTFAALAAEVGFESAAVSLRAPNEYNRQRFDGLVSELRASPRMTPDQRDRLSQVVLVYNGQAVVGCKFPAGTESAERVIFCNFSDQLCLSYIHITFLKLDGA